MVRDTVRAEVVRRLKEIGMGEIAPDWQGCDAVWEIFEKMASEGSTVVIKIDGQRTKPDDNGRYTVVVSGGPLGEEFFRLDTPVLEDGLARAILHFTEKCWRKI